MKTTTKLVILAICTMLLTLSSCTKSDDKRDYSVAEEQLERDYGNTYEIGEVTWKTVRGSHMGTFYANPKTRSEAVNTTITVWYLVSGDNAEREMDSKELGTVVPSILSAAFNATKYSNATIWRIVEIELDNDYTSNGIFETYEMELEYINDTNLEAELYFNEIGTLIFSEESFDNDSNEDDKYVITAGLANAVEDAHPGADIVDAEIEDNMIEVDAVANVNGKVVEIEMLFTRSYQLISDEVETDYTYGTLPTDILTPINAWFASNTTIPKPPTITPVEVKKGEQIYEGDIIDIEYNYSVEFDDYVNGELEFEVEFFLDENYNIEIVVVNDVEYSL